MTDNALWGQIYAAYATAISWHRAPLTRVSPWMGSRPADAAAEQFVSGDLV